jgi:hypothetical protein
VTAVLDRAAVAALVTSGRYAHGRIEIPDTAQYERVGAGLAPGATLTDRKAALLAAADFYADLQAPADLDLCERDDAADAADDHLEVVRGLTPAMSGEDRDRAWDALTLATCAIADLLRHQQRGTTPRYLQRDGASVQLAVLAEIESWESEARDVAGRMALTGGAL